MTRHTLTARMGALALAAATGPWLAGCAAVEGRLGISYQNRPEPGQLYGSPQTPVPRAATEWQADKPAFVGLALSGGGSRSANFGMAALTELHALGLLQQVDAVSAVSGGSIPAAFLAVHGTDPDWPTRGRQVAGTDFVTPLLGRLASPWNALATTFTDRDRTDVLAELFDERVLGGKTLRFSDLGVRGPMRPAVYFNATDTTNGGTRFVFQDDAFFFGLGSDLSAYPVSWAMAASGAFPGIFNSVTLRRYGLTPPARQAEDKHPEDRRYTHLIDGGASDNLGIDTLLDLAGRHHMARRNAGQPYGGCLLIVVDSHVPSLAFSEARQSDRRNVASMLLDLNFLDAIDGMLSNRRAQTLERLGIRRDLAMGQYSVPLGNGQVEHQVRPYLRVGSVALDYHEVAGRTVSASRYATSRRSPAMPPPESARRQLQCTTWHVALDEVQAIPVGPASEARPRAGETVTDAASVYRARLSRLIGQVQTSYRLSGPPHCGPDVVQQALYDAARIAVRQDHDALARICPWFIERGLASPDTCRPDPQPLARSQPVLEPIDRPRDETVQEHATKRFVRCPAPTDGW